MVDLILKLVDSKGNFRQILFKDCVLDICLKSTNNKADILIKGIHNSQFTLSDVDNWSTVRDIFDYVTDRCSEVGHTYLLVLDYNEVIHKIKLSEYYGKDIFVGLSGITAS